MAQGWGGGGLGGPPAGGVGGSPPGYGWPGQPAGYGHGAPAPQPHGVGGYGAPTGYEFQREDHETIRTTGQRARAWGICALVIGALLILFAGLIFLWSTFFAGVLGLAFLIPVGLQALVLLACGWFYLDAGVTLDRVVTTQGRDVPLMMEALARLTTAFKIETFALGAALIFGFVLGLIFAT